MTESEWLSCTDPQRLLNFLRGKVSDRKGKLFICALCRLNWDLLYDPASQECVEEVERLVDGQATEEELHSAQYYAECPTFGFDFSPGIWKEWTKPGEIPAGVRGLIRLGIISEKDLEQDTLALDPNIVARLRAAVDLAY